MYLKLKFLYLQKDRGALNRVTIVENIKEM